MKISVIIPFKDAERWLPRCLKSLKAQKGNFEFILVDDNGYDDNDDLRIAGLFEKDDSRFKLLRTGGIHSRGVSVARNHGISFATGDWITFLDADDEWLPDAWEIFKKALMVPAEINIIQMNHYRYYAEINKTAFKYTNKAGAYSLQRGIIGLPEQWCMVWNKLYRRDFIEHHNIRFDECLQFGEDELFNLEAFDCDNSDFILHAPRSLAVLKRNFDNKKSLSHIKKAVDLIRQSDELAWFAKNAQKPQMRRLTCELIADHWKSKTYEDAFIKQL